jgi:integrase
MEATTKSTTSKRLTKSVVEALPLPLKGGAAVTTWDTDLRGFGIRISDCGTRTYFVHGRMKNGRQTKVTIGRHGPVTCEQARARAKALLGQIAAGDDPAAERRQVRQAERERRAAPDVAELCDRYLAEHVDVHNKPRTRAENRRMVERIIKPKLGHLKVEAIDHDDVARLHRELKRTPRQANHAVAILSKMFNLAEVWKDDSNKKLRPLNSNPCRHLQRYQETARDRFPLPEELERVGVAMREMEVEGGLRPEIAACIRFLALVGCRLSEAVELDLRNVDFRTGAWTLPNAKAGARTVMLGAPALALLASMERTTGRAFVREDGTPITTHMVERAWIGDKLQPKHRKKGRLGIRGRAGVPDLRIHDLRHGVGTYAGAAGLNAFLIRDLLGHRTLSMTGRYVSKHVDPLRAAADAVSKQIAAALEGNQPAEVVNLPTRSAG